LALDEGERITAILPYRDFSEGGFIFMATSSGTVKKVAVEAFARQRTSGLIALELDGDDCLVGVAITDGSQNVMLFTSEGKGIRFKETDVRAMGRTARGVRGIKVPKEHKVISLIIEQEDCQVLSASSNGFGKRTNISDFSVQGRGGQGVIAMVTNDRNGTLVGAVQVSDADEIMLISDQGTLVRTRVDEISVLGRNTQGVTLIRVSNDEHLVGVERIDEPEGDDDGESVESESSSSEVVEASVESSEGNESAPEASDSDASDASADTGTDTGTDTGEDADPESDS